MAKSYREQMIDMVIEMSHLDPEEETLEMLRDFSKCLKAGVTVWKQIYETVIELLYSGEYLEMFESWLEDDGVYETLVTQLLNIHDAVLEKLVEELEKTVQYRKLFIERYGREGDTTKDVFSAHYNRALVGSMEMV